jgi:hypothetical protein
MFDELLERQAGIITRGQALAAGLSASAIRARVALGRWLPAFRGGYRTFTGEPPRAAVLWAALLRAGAGAALSHQSAAELLGLTDCPSDPIHVSIPARRRIRPIPGVVVHHRAGLAETVQPGPALCRTRVEDTVLALWQATSRPETAVGWIVAACARRLTTPDRLVAAMHRRKQLCRRRLLAAVLDDTSAGAHSVLERRYLRDVERAHRLPRGRRQARHHASGGTRYRDVAYHEFGAAVELDGRAYHPAERRRADQRRDNEAADGLRTLRYGWTDVTAPCSTAVQVARALRAGGWRDRLGPCRRRDCAARRVIRKT